MTGNAETVMGIYEAFGRGDVGHILDQMSDDVAWDHGIRETGLPYLVPGTGKDHVARFFQAVAENLEFTTFEPATPCVNDDTVMVAVREIGRNIVTGAPVEEDISVHIWTFGPDGKVVAFRHVVDIAHHEAAAQAVTTTSTT